MKLRENNKTIGELVSGGIILAIQDGNHGGSHPKSSEYVAEGIPFIMASDITQGRLVLEGCKRLTKERADRLRVGFAKTGDILLTHKGTVGEVAIVPPVSEYVMLTPQVTYYRPNPDLVDRRYLALAFRSPDFQAQLSGISAQSTRPYVAISTQRYLSVPWFPISVQHRIADILGAYDELIELNRQKISVLEEIARRLFEEWFVRFRYPDHEGVSHIDTPEGPLPKAWSWQRIGDVTTYVNRGIAPRYDDGAESLVVGQKCIRAGRLSLGPARKQSKKVPPEKIVREGDILINSTGVGTLGRVAQAEAVPAGLTVDSHVTIVRPAEAADRDYLGMQLLQMQPTFEHLGAGSTGQTELARGAIQDQAIAWPPRELRVRFGRVVRPMREHIDQLMGQNYRLSASRDLLLPRLMSGQLSLPAPECDLEAA